MKKSFLIYLSITIVMVSCRIDDCCVTPEPSELSRNIGNIVANSPLPGLAVTIVKHDLIQFQEAYGNANVTDSKPYDNQTIQPIGSISKTFIGLALMKAIEQGHFTLETPINDILPFQVVLPDDANSVIKIKHLVTHTSGLVDKEETYIGSYYIMEGEDLSLPMSQYLVNQLGLQQDNPNATALGSFLESYYVNGGALYSEDNFDGTAGENYEYSNIAASLAAYLIEVKTGVSYNEYVKTHIFQPLGMDNTAFFYDELPSEKLATLYHTEENLYPKYGSYSYPDGFLKTSNQDLGAYLLEMAKGSNGTGTLISQENYEVLFTKNTHPDWPSNYGHSVFWGVKETEGRIEHNGSDPGLTTLISINPQNNSGFLAMTNIGTDADNAQQVQQALQQVAQLIVQHEASN